MIRVQALIRSRTHRRCSWSGQIAYQYVQPDALTGRKKGEAGLLSHASLAQAMIFPVVSSAAGERSLGGEKKARVKSDHASSRWAGLT